MSRRLIKIDKCSFCSKKAEYILVISLLCVPRIYTLCEEHRLEWVDGHFERLKRGWG